MKAFREDKPEDITLPPFSHGLVLPLQWRRKEGRGKAPCVVQAREPDLDGTMQDSSPCSYCLCEPVVNHSSDQEYCLFPPFENLSITFFLPKAKFNLRCLTGVEF